MDIFRFKLDRPKLDAAPEDERTLFLLLGHFINQAAILGKWINWCQDKDAPQDSLERKGQAAQAMMALSLFAAKLNEGWELLQKQYFGTQISKTYSALLEREAVESLKDLGRYFGSENALNTCRNEYAFHYDSNAMKSHYATLPKDEDTDIYLAEANGLSLYHVAEMAAAHSLITKLGNGDRQKGMLRLVEESLKVSLSFQSFAAGFMLAFLKRIGDPSEPIVEKIGSLPNFETVKIPFLADFENEGGGK